MDGAWLRTVEVEDIDVEDVVRFDHGDRTFAVYRSPDDVIYATDGWCTHEQAHLADGLVMGHLVECPKHNGRFDYRSGAARRIPACVDVKTYPVKVEDGVVYVKLD